MTCDKVMPASVAAGEGLVVRCQGKAVKGGAEGGEEATGGTGREVTGRAEEDAEGEKQHNTIESKRERKKNWH